MSAEKFKLYDEQRNSISISVEGDSNESMDTINAKHAMQVTGVTSDGYYIVSTNGKKCYVDPNDGGTYTFEAYHYGE